MTMIKTLRVMLIPNKKQNTRLFQFAGSARFAFNWALAQEKKNFDEGGKFISDYELRRLFTQFKQQTGNEWLYTISNNVCKQAIKDAVIAYQKFFKGLAQHPKFKSRKRNKPGFYADPVKIKFSSTHVKLENIAQSKKKNRQSANWFRLAEHNRIPTECSYSNPHITFDGLNWFLTVGIECEAPKPAAGADGIGIDVGVKDLAICSTGHVYKNINKTSRVRRLKKKARRLQRKLSRKYIKNKKGESYRKTRNIIKSEKQLLRRTHRLTNIRTNHIHQVTTEIVKREPSFIVMEDLNVSGMMKNRYLARAVQEQKLAEFYRIMQYKSDWNGIRLITADRFYASSKLCSVCGHKKKDLKLKDRIYRCPECGTVIDRDLNASLNLYHYGKSILTH
ncbi:MAG: transposase [Synergistaceae bacterium]|nr:transposase [Synergistaceae bacterium]